MVGATSLLLTALLASTAAANHALGHQYAVADPLAGAEVGARGLFDEGAGHANGMGRDHWKRASKAKVVGAAASRSASLSKSKSISKSKSVSKSKSLSISKSKSKSKSLSLSKSKSHAVSESRSESKSKSISLSKSKSKSVSKSKGKSKSLSKSKSKSESQSVSKSRSASLSKSKAAAASMKTTTKSSAKAKIATAKVTTTTTKKSTTTTTTKYTTTVWPTHANAAAASATAPAWKGTSKFTSAGVSGVSAMQMAVVDDDHVLIFDKSEHNALQVNGASAWGSLYTISTKKVKALGMKTNTFCAGGGWLGNGTMVSVGGNAVENTNPTEDGRTGLRMFTPCDGDDCEIYENPSRLHLTSDRWYPSTTRLDDGSLIIFGGMIAAGYNNQESTDNPTLEFWPPKGTGLAVYSTFLHDALNTNLFPVTFLLPSGDIFVAANTMAMTYNWRTNMETRLPGFANGVKINYPASPANALLPLTIANAWTPEVLICGGTNADTDGHEWKLTSQTPGSNQCSRMVINKAGIKKGWQVEYMTEARVMSDAILTPDGQVLLINGAKTGVAGYGNVLNEVGKSNADNPNYRPTLYEPDAAKGKRFSTKFPSSSIERLYHSSASLLPDGRIMVAGSNPNGDVSTTTYRTRYDVEIFAPPYVSMTRPSFKNYPSNIYYGNNFTVTVSVPSGTKVVRAVLMDLGYSTHGVHMSQRWVEMVASVKGTKMTVKAPAKAGIFPPGPGWMYVLADGIPSKGFKIMMGDASTPVVDSAALKYQQAHTTPSA